MAISGRVESRVNTIYDWSSLAIFAGLAVIFLQRSVEPEASDRLIDYLPPAIGCAAANWAGNHDHPVIAVLILGAVVAHIVLILKPFATR